MTAKTKHLCCGILCCILLFFNKAFADSDIFGGQISYRFVSTDTVEVEVLVYKMCWGLTQPDNKIYVSPVGNNTFSVTATLDSNRKDVTPVCGNQCSSCHGSCGSFYQGIKRYRLSAKIDLSSYRNVCDFTFAWKGSDRYIFDTDPYGNTFYIEAHATNICNAGRHNSPQFSTGPLLLVPDSSCISKDEGGPLQKDDSIAVSLIEPLSDVSMPEKYVSSYSYTSPLKTGTGSSCGSFNLDKETGILNFRTTKAQSSLYAVRLTLYSRNTAGKMVKVSDATRDMGIIVMGTAKENEAPQLSFSDTTMTGNHFYICSNLPQKYYLVTRDASDSVSLDYSSDIPGASIKIINNRVQYLDISWTPANKDVRKKPYRLVVHAKDNGCTLRRSQEEVFLFYVNDSFPLLKPVVSDSGCGKLSFSVSADSSYKMSYNWRLDNNILSTQASGTYQLSKNNNTNLILRASSRSGCTETLKIPLSISSFPTPDAGKDTLICKGSSVTLHGSGNGSYEWYPKKWLSATNIANPVATPDSTITYYLKLTNSKGCTQTDSVTIRLNDFNIRLPADTAICLGRSFVIKAKGPSNLHYNWYPEAGVGNPNTLITSFKPSKTTLYALTATDLSGCSFMAHFKVTVSSLSPDAGAGPDQTICRGDSVQLYAHGGYSYHWNNINTNQSDIPNPYVKPSVSQIYTVVIKDSIGCGKQFTVKVNVNDLDISISPDQLICKGDTAELSATEGYNCYWSPAKGLSHTTGAKVKASPDSTTVYSVKMENPSNGCSKTATVKVTVSRNCVWPGDADNNDKVNYLDILPIGVAYNSYGSKRSIVSTDWGKYPSADWTLMTGSGINYKYIDANGDGYIDTLDADVVSKNYGSAHQKDEPALAGGSGNPPVFFEFQKDTFYAGEVVNAALLAGTPSYPVWNVYGLGVSYSYLDAILKHGSFNFLFDCSFLCPNEFALTLQKDFGGNAEASIVKTNHSYVDGNGKISNISMKLKDTTEYSYPEKGQWLYLRMKSCKVIDPKGKDLEVSPISDSVLVLKKKKVSKGTGINAIQSTPAFSIYPNPAGSFFVVKTANASGSVELMTTVGQIIKIIPLSGEKEIRIDTQYLAPGLYFIRLKSQQGFFGDKLIIKK